MTHILTLVIPITAKREEPKGRVAVCTLQEGASLDDDRQAGRGRVSR